VTISRRVSGSSERVFLGPERLYRLAALPLLGTLLLVGCSVLNTLMPERAVRGMLETLPQPAGVTLIDEVTRGTHGSDERCIGASSYRLYGTQQAFDRVLAFYDSSLPGDTWHMVEDRSPPAVWRSPANHFALVVSSNVEATFIPSESIDSGRERFPTLYYVALSYVNNPDYCRAF
jgi:hypothetical protein